MSELTPDRLTDYHPEWYDWRELTWVLTWAPFDPGHHDWDEFADALSRELDGDAPFVHSDELDGLLLDAPSAPVPAERLAALLGWLATLPGWDPADPPLVGRRWEPCEWCRGTGETLTKAPGVRRVRCEEDMVAAPCGYCDHMGGRVA